MHVERLLCKDFRNYEGLSVEFDRGINVIFGDNAQGKTNVLEALFLSATGRSHRTHYDKELIRFGAESCYIHTFIKDTVSEKISLHIRSDAKKGIAVNNMPIKKIGELLGIFLVVMFSPEDLDLIKSGPSERRRYMDIEICKLNKVYYFELGQYYNILKQRNSMLKNMKNVDYLSVWDSQLVKSGRKIIAYRQAFIDKINIFAEEIHKRITDGKEEIKIIYKPNVSIDDFEKKLSRNLDRDIKLGTTGVGIHKDDVEFLINGLDTRIYGSQGQQRTASLSAKLAEIKLMELEKKQSPVLLLDDVLSELDEKRQSFLMEQTKNIQTIITVTGFGLRMSELFKDTGSMFMVKNGTIGNIIKGDAHVTRI